MQWYSEGRTWSENYGDKQKGYELYKKASEVDPKYANAYFGMATCNKEFK